jgi:chitodextrinase
MAASQMLPAGWYLDPVHRHEYRYWGGTNWTASVADGTVTAIDDLGSASVPPPQHSPNPPPLHLSEPSPVTSPLAPSGKRRERRRRAVLSIAIAAAVAAGAVAGLVIWSPWTNPPLTRPTGLMAGHSTADSVAFRWSRPAAGQAPDSYEILRAGKVIRSVRGTVTSFRQAGLAPATTYRYQVAAVRGSQRSAVSSVLVVSTATPPLSAARLQGSWTVRLKLVQRGGLIGATRWTESWLTSPTCAAGRCAVLLAGSIDGHQFTARLHGTGTQYAGTARTFLFPCRSGARSFPVRDTMTFRLKVTGARADNRAWVASSWTGDLMMSNPYTASGSFFCSASSQTAALASHR